MDRFNDAPMLGVGSDAVLAALATVVRKPKRLSSVTRASKTSTSSSIASIKSLRTARGSWNKDTQTLSKGHCTGTSHFAAVSSASLCSTDPQTVGIGSDAVLINTASVKSKRRKISLAKAAPTLPLVAANPLVDDASAGDVTNAAQPPHINCSSNSLLVSATSNSCADNNLSTQISMKFDGDTALSTSKSKRPAVTFCPSTNLTQAPNSGDLTSIAAPHAKSISSFTVQYPDVNNFSKDSLTGVTETCTGHEKVKRSLHNSDDKNEKLLPDVQFYDFEFNQAEDTETIPFTALQPFKRQTGSVVVGYWFNSDRCGETELVKFIQKAVKRIQMGVDRIDQIQIIQEVCAAVSRGVVVQILLNYKKSCDGGLQWVKVLLEAGVKVCHSTEDFKWQGAIFDGQVVMQGFQSSMRSAIHDMDYTVVHTGPIAVSFECQFDEMWKAASKEVLNRSKCAKSAVQGGKRKSSNDLGNKSHDVQLGTKRYQEKRTSFPTTLEFLEMLGF